MDHATTSPTPVALWGCVCVGLFFLRTRTTLARVSCGRCVDAGLTSPSAVPAGLTPPSAVPCRMRRPPLRISRGSVAPSPAPVVYTPVSVVCTPVVCTLSVVCTPVVCTRGSSSRWRCMRSPPHSTSLTHASACRSYWRRAAPSPTCALPCSRWVCARSRHRR